MFFFTRQEITLNKSTSQVTLTNTYLTFNKYWNTNIATTFSIYVLGIKIDRMPCCHVLLHYVGSLQFNKLLNYPRVSSCLCKHSALLMWWLARRSPCQSRASLMVHYFASFWLIFRSWHDSLCCRAPAQWVIECTFRTKNLVDRRHNRSTFRDISARKRACIRSSARSRSCLRKSRLCQGAPMSLHGM